MLYVENETLRWISINKGRVWLINKKGTDTHQTQIPSYLHQNNIQRATHQDHIPRAAYQNYRPRVTYAKNIEHRLITKGEHHLCI